MLQDNELSHKPVMLGEMLEYLAPKKDELFLDCTFGAGGYSKAILDKCQCNVVAIDRDPMVECYTHILTGVYQSRFKFINANFAEISQFCAEIKFNGIVADLGVSSMQLETKERGFSFSRNGPLDMRMSNSGMSAAEFINSATEADIADVIYQYGDEPAARKIARSIINERKVAPILDTIRLAEIVRGCIGFRKGKIDTATKTFQAIRIYINDELGQLRALLSQVQNLLASGGRVVIISFHSLEDRIVKEYFKNNSSKIATRSKYARVEREQDIGLLKIITKKPITSSKNEILTNPRSRSAKLRAATML